MDNKYYSSNASLPLNHSSSQPLEVITLEENHLTNIPKQLVNNYASYNEDEKSIYIILLYVISKAEKKYSKHLGQEIDGLEVELPPLAQIERETGFQAERFKYLIKEVAFGIRFRVFKENYESYYSVRIFKRVDFHKINKTIITKLILDEEGREFLSPKNNYYKVWSQLIIKKKSELETKILNYLIKLNFKNIYPIKTETLFKNLDIKPKEIRKKGRGKIIKEIEDILKKYYSVLDIKINKPIYEFKNDLWKLQTIYKSDENKKTSINKKRK